MRCDARISDWRSLKPAGSPPRAAPRIGYTEPSRPASSRGGTVLALDKMIYISVESARGFFVFLCYRPCARGRFHVILSVAGDSVCPWSASIAQLVEHRSRKAGVIGSSPIAGSSCSPKPGSVWSRAFCYRTPAGGDSACKGLSRRVKMRMRHGIRWSRVSDLESTTVAQTD